MRSLSEKRARWRSTLLLGGYDGSGKLIMIAGVLELRFRVGFMCATILVLLDL